MPGELEFIQWLRQRQSASAAVALAAGDDLALLRWPVGQWLVVGADQVLDGVHFDSAQHSPRLIGQKAMNRNLSDCAAMAALPVAAVATVALPRGTSVAYAKELYLGASDAGEKFGCAIVGGDTGSWEGKLAISIAIFAKSDGIDPIRRSGAKPGDAIYVSGPLGGSIGGRHLSFTPRVKEARALAQSGRLSAMIDISDGLSRDLAHICAESAVGAVLRAEAIPVRADVAQLGGDALSHALNDGEDYELLYTVRPGAGAIEGHVIGHIVAEPGMVLEHRDGRREILRPRGWEHGLS